MTSCVIRIPAKDSYSTQGPALMGRQSANEGFLQSWFRYTDHAEYWCMARFRTEAQVFARIGEEVHRASRPSLPTYRWIAQMQIHRAAGVGTLYLPGPQVAAMAWVRHRDPQARAEGLSIVGMTHTRCELPVQDSLADMLTAPVQPWDAQICPSQSVRTMVQRLLDDEAAWLTAHLGATRVRIPELPVLPLGIECDRFDLPQARQQALRQQWRTRWQLTPGEVCVLYVGRLDLRTKANLYPTLDALELAARRLAPSGPRLVLVLGGWFASDWDEATLRQAVQEACPSVRVVFEDGRTPAFREGAWQGADLFTSLVDNIQETFGLTPLEAMAAGLPVVVSDYDGYRESVPEGVAGFRVATSQPPAGAGLDLMDTHADHMVSYRDYVGTASALIGVDVAAAAQAYERLARDPALRQRMGQAGRAHVRQHYDWRGLVPRYQALFEDLARVRRAAGGADAARHAAHTAEAARGLGARHPRRSDPFHSFAHYPSLTLAASLIARPGPLLAASATEHAAQLDRMRARPVYATAAPHLRPAELLPLLARVAAAPQGLALAAWLPADPRTAQACLRQVGWLHKCGLLTLEGGGLSPAR